MAETKIERRLVSTGWDPVCVTGPKYLIYHLLPHRVCIRKKLDPKRSSKNSNQHSDRGYGCSRWQLNPLCQMPTSFALS